MLIEIDEKLANALIDLIDIADEENLLDANDCELLALNNPIWNLKAEIMNNENWG